MTDDELNRKFDIVAAHLASLAVSQQKAEERQQKWEERQQKAEEREQRSDYRISRLERVLLLAIRAGRRERGEWRTRHAALVDAQIRTEDKLGALAEAHTRLADAQTNLADAQAHTDRRLDALIDIVREDREDKRNRNGESD